jgi:hypothetical protein
MRPMPPPKRMDPPAYRGWFRASKRSPWIELAADSSYDGAWQSLLDAIPRGSRGGDSVVLQADERPTGSVQAGGATCAAR